MQWKSANFEDSRWHTTVGAISLDIIKRRWGQFAWSIYLEDWGQDYPPPRIELASGLHNTFEEADHHAVAALRETLAAWQQELEEKSK